ncbi:hypothetical protein AVEN_27672-1 [Araneus ventricosus]|uniref:Sulfotransferase domain-containing protein n=1 Tax=Araneus ventricosus TaxID=182803 RepID=A0A4Y2RHJ9_ARAVE|nr:hypothetical protein AVEN_178100-1 [Araneus ventricosus]GBN75287.1 hypothetical protein AVEN_207103-1 [Araneus ventricosus]GBN85120.1 hypothetical protein AVEN_260040-1 [Araneus ventricosus]GBN85128.1 hypothetical protein AVEN_27672-1 [Araneus ventricosus]
MSTTNEELTRNTKCPYTEMWTAMFSVDAFKSAMANNPRPDNLFFVTFPKCGKTWVQNIVVFIFSEGRTFNSGLEMYTEGYIRWAVFRQRFPCTLG